MLKIEQLIAEARATPDSEVAEPPFALEECDHVVGVLEDSDLKKLYNLMRVKGDALRRAAKQLPESERTKENVTLAVLDEEYTRVKDLFWTELRAAYPDIANKLSVGVRAEWQVVWSENSLELFLDALLQGAA